MDTFTDITFNSQLFISAIGVFMNIAHLTILLHPTMRISSTNSIMIGIALSDIIMLSSIFYDRVSQFFITTSPNITTSPGVESYHHEMSQWIGTFWSNILEQTPLWLGVFLALIRLLLMKIPSQKDFLSSPMTGYVVVFATTTVTSMASVYFYFTLEQEWNAQDSEQELKEAVNFYVSVSGISQISISLIYPLLTIFLFFEIRKTANLSNTALTKKNLLERHRSAKMILVMTVFYVIYSAPTGSLDFIQLFVPMNPILEALVEYGSVFVSTLFCLNAISHSVINFFMSTKYRNTLKMMLGVKNKMVLVSVSRSV